MFRTKLVWAYMLPRHIWHGAHSDKASDLARRKTNKLAGKIVCRNCGAVIA